MTHATRQLQFQLTSTLLLAGLAVMLSLIAGAIFGSGMALVAVGLVIASSLILPHVPPAFVMRLHRARPLRRGEAPAVERLIAELAQRAGLASLPACHVLPSPQLNAFATGSPEQGAIAISAGLLRHLDERQLSGVLAHEISHLAQRDVSLLQLAGSFAKAIQLLSHLLWLLLLISLPLMLAGAVVIGPALLLLMVCAPPAALLLVQALSRTREYAADLHAAELLGTPLPLADALASLERFQNGRRWWPWMRQQVSEEVPLWLRSHPPTQDRIARLHALSAAPQPSSTGNPPVIIPERIASRQPRQGFAPAPIRIVIRW